MALCWVIVINIVDLSHLRNSFPLFQGNADDAVNDHIKEATMAITNSLSFPISGLSARAGAGISQVAAYVWRVVTTRQALAEMDDRMLKDLGISRAQAQFEISRPVWKLFR
jgi:uncharacterized protein YjiS (DUF1127 family)